MSYFVSWLPFRSSSLCDSNASSICALVCASFGELRSACPSMAHDSRSHWCKKWIQRSRKDVDNFCALHWGPNRWCPQVSFMLGRIAGGIILCTRFPGDREIDKHHPPTTFTRSGEKLIDLQCWEVMLDSKTILKHLPFQEICYFISKTDKIRFIPIQYCCTRFINMTPPTSSKGKIGFYIIFLIALL